MMESIYVLFYWITPKNNNFNKPRSRFKRTMRWKQFLIDMFCGEIEKWHLSNKDTTNFAMFLFVAKLLYKSKCPSIGPSVNHA